MWDRRDAYGSLVARLVERDHFEDLELDGITILKMDVPEMLLRGVDWIEVAQDEDSWRALVNEVMNFRVL